MIGEMDLEELNPHLASERILVPGTIPYLAIDGADLAGATPRPAIDSTHHPAAEALQSTFDDAEISTISMRPRAKLQDQ